jgi:hypothetical protein
VTQPRPVCQRNGVASLLIGARRVKDASRGLTQDGEFLAARSYLSAGTVAFAIVLVLLGCTGSHRPAGACARTVSALHEVTGPIDAAASNLAVAPAAALRQDVADLATKVRRVRRNLDSISGTGTIASRLGALRRDLTVAEQDLANLFATIDARGLNAVGNKPQTAAGALEHAYLVAESLLESCKA